ncbi:MAG: hypothetical protein GX189_02840 [Clostridiales bacterium]|nr:hypothetical protein [Clostridiales bacterium]
MKAVKRLSVLILIAALFIAQAANAYAADDEADKAAQFRAEIVRLVNEEREKAGLQPLEEHEELAKAAQARAEEAAESFSHTRPDGRRWSTVFAEYELKYKAAGENLAAGFKTAAAMVKAWMNSDGHRANILAGDFTYIGIGFYVRADGRIYVAQLFYTPLS